MISLEQVKNFWEESPLWSGESKLTTGTKEFFEEHRQTYINDCFAGSFDLRFYPPPRQAGQALKILDLGCGIGFWVTEFAMRGFVNLTAADLTQQALAITKLRLNHYDVNASLSQQNAEQMDFGDQIFDHVNCQGVIHHTPNTEQTIKEIARVLGPEGTASISVYYRNLILLGWPYLRWLGWALNKLGGGLRGRGRENIFLEKEVDQIVRLYDGSKNPLGKSFTREQFVRMLEPHFVVKEIYYHFFPARALPFDLPKIIHRWLDKNLGFMIYATVQKK